MSMSACLKHYLDQHHVNYNLIPHRPTDTAFNSAKAAHIPMECMVKGVLLHDEQGYMMAAVSPLKEVDLDRVNEQTGRNLELANEEKLNCILNDCEVGAVPAIGEAFGIPTIWDQQLESQPSFYIEAGDHRELVRMSHYEFMDMMADDAHGRISH